MVLIHGWLGETTTEIRIRYSERKAVSKLMGHAKEIITMDVYGDNQGIIADGVPEIREYIEEVLPKAEEHRAFLEELLDIEIDAGEYVG